MVFQQSDLSAFIDDVRLSGVKGDLEKAKKDLSKLSKVKVTDKNGHSVYRWVKKNKINQSDDKTPLSDILAGAPDGNFKLIINGQGSVVYTKSTLSAYMKKHIIQDMKYKFGGYILEDQTGNEPKQTEDSYGYQKFDKSNDAHIQTITDKFSSKFPDLEFKMLVNGFTAYDNSSGKSKPVFNFDNLKIKSNGDTKGNLYFNAFKDIDSAKETILAKKGNEIKSYKDKLAYITGITGFDAVDILQTDDLIGKMKAAAKSPKSKSKAPKAPKVKMQGILLSTEEDGVGLKFKIGDTNIQNGSKGIKVDNAKWVTYDDYLASWGGTLPTIMDKKFGSKSEVLNSIQDFQNSKNEKAQKEQKTQKIENQTTVDKYIHKLLIESKSRQEIIDTIKKDILSWDVDTFDALISQEDGRRILKDVHLSLSKKSGVNLGDSLFGYLKGMDDDDDNTPNKKANADFSKCSIGQIALIRLYTGSHYSMINRFNVGKDKVSDPKIEHILKLTVGTMNKGIKNIVNNKQYDKVYRGFSPKGSDDDIKKHMVDYMMKTGLTMNQGTILSTSHSGPRMGNKILMVITNPTEGKIVSDISNHPGEDELLFPTTTNFRVVEVTRKEKPIYEDYFKGHSQNLVQLEQV